MATPTTPTPAPPKAAAKRPRKTKRPWLAVEHDPREDPESPKAIVIASFTTQTAGLTYIARQRARQHDTDTAYSLIKEAPARQAPSPA